MGGKQNILKVKRGLPHVKKSEKKVQVQGLQELPVLQILQKEQVIDSNVRQPLTSHVNISQPLTNRESPDYIIFRHMYHTDKNFANRVYESETRM